MTKIALSTFTGVIISLLFATSSHAATYSSVVLADNPRFYFELNEASNALPVADSANAAVAPQSGAQNGAYDQFVPGDSAVTVGVPGISGGGAGNTAASFPDNVLTAPLNSQIYVADTFNPTAYSIEMWVKPSVIRDQTLFVRTASNPATTFSHALSMRLDGTFESYTFDGATNTIASTTAAESGRWHHVVATAANGGGMSLYVNGVLETQTTSGIGALWTGGNQYRIGATSGVGTWYAGDMDEVALYSDVLSAAEVGEHYIAGNADVSLEVSTFDDASDLDFKSNYTVHAVNVSADAGPYVVNGIAFESSGVSGTDVPGVTFTGGNQLNTWGTKPSFGATTNDNNLEEIMHDIRYAPAPTSMSFTADVTVGLETTVSLLFSENLDGFLPGSRAFDIFIEGIQVADEFDVLAQTGDWTGSPDKGLLLAFTYLAMDDELNVEFRSGSVAPDKNPILAAFVVEQVPEPSTYLLAAFGAFGIALLMRRKRRGAA